MKSILVNGHKIAYFVQNIGPSENHKSMVPKQIPYSPAFLCLERILRAILKYKISRSRFGFPSPRNLYRQIKSFDPDVIVVKSCRMYSQFAIWIGKILRKPVILYNQTPLVQTVTRQFSTLRCIATALGFRPRVVFTPVSGILLGEKPLKRGNTYHIPLVVEPSPFKRIRSYQQDGIIKILAVGKYQDLAKKRHDLLIRAFYELSEKLYPLALTFVGSGRDTDPRLSYLREFVQDLHLESRISFALNVPNDKMTEIYAAHDLFVLPSRWEGYGYSVLEAMAAGLPVIASDRAGARDCIDDGVNGYIFKSEDLASLTDAIEKVIRNHDVLEKMGAASLEIVKQRYLPHVYHDRLMYLLKEEFGLVDSKCSFGTPNGSVTENNSFSTQV